MSIVSDIIGGRELLTKGMFEVKCIELGMELKEDGSYSICVDGVEIVMRYQGGVVIDFGDIKVLPYKLSDSFFVVMCSNTLKEISFSYKIVERYWRIYVVQVEEFCGRFS